MYSDRIDYSWAGDLKGSLLIVKETRVVNLPSFGFKVVSSAGFKRELSIQAASEEERKSWVVEIEAAASASTVTASSVDTVAKPIRENHFGQHAKSTDIYLKLATGIALKDIPEIEAAGKINKVILVAVSKGDAEVTNLLLRHGVSQCSKDNGVGIAARQGHFEVLQLLLDNGAAITALSEEGYSLTTLAAYSGSVACVRLVLDRGCTVGDACIHAANCDNVDIIRALLNAGATPCDASPDGVTPMMIAARHGHINIIQFLLVRGGSVLGTGEYACEQGNTDVLKFLLENGETLPPSEKFGFHYNNVKFLTFMLENALPIPSGWLYLFALNGDAEAVKLLLENGLDNEDICNPSHYHKYSEEVKDFLIFRPPLSRIKPSPVALSPYATFTEQLQLNNEVPQKVWLRMLRLFKSKHLKFENGNAEVVVGAQIQGELTGLAVVRDFTQDAALVVNDLADVLLETFMLEASEGYSSLPVDVVRDKAMKWIVERMHSSSQRPDGIMPSSSSSSGSHASARDGNGATDMLQSAVADMGLDRPFGIDSAMVKAARKFSK